MIDYHNHLLPGLDDGPSDVSESIAMAASLAQFGYQTVCCTPHFIRGYYDNSPEQVRQATLMLQADLDQAAIPLQLWPGMEYMLDECFADFSGPLRTLGPTRLVLCEAPPQADVGIVYQGLQRIFSRGLVPLVAHPERSPVFYHALGNADGAPRQPDDPWTDRLDATKPAAATAGVDTGLSRTTRSFWRRWLSRSVPQARLSIEPPPAGVLFHANLGSFTGYYGPEVQRRAYQLLKAGSYTTLATDLHDLASVPKVLVADKFETNPLLSQLAGWDGGDCRVTP